MEQLYRYGWKKREKRKEKNNTKTYRRLKPLGYILILTIRRRTVASCFTMWGVNWGRGGAKNIKIRRVPEEPVPVGHPRVPNAIITSRAKNKYECHVPTRNIMRPNYYYSFVSIRRKTILYIIYIDDLPDPRRNEFVKSTCARKVLHTINKSRAESVHPPSPYPFARR